MRLRRIFPVFPKSVTQVEDPSVSSHEGSWEYCECYWRRLFPFPKPREWLFKNEVDGPRVHPQSEVSQKEKTKYCMLTHIYGI